MLLTILGMAAGFAGSLFVTRAMEAILFGVSTTDPAVLACIAILLLATAALACWLPARSAMRLDPMSALRSD
jgi:ABC-type antimicrobial peptide transport system permease subunit